ncbi:DeoR/GlpR family DNA-binding transcription regulator [Lachnospiraceae bacterium ZAX-1]
MNEKQKRRLKEMDSMLEEKVYMPIKELSEKLNISEMTVRRDFDIISQSKNLYMVNGVIFRNLQKAEEYKVPMAEVKKAAEKEAIAKLAVSLIREGDVIALDVGTTTEQVAKFIPKGMDITVICYSFNILCRLRTNGISKIVFGGGTFHENSQTFESKEAVRLIQKHRVNKAFISAAGVSESLGITCMNEYEVPLKQAVIQSSLKKILVIDSSKYQQVKPAYFADADIFDYVITDKELSKEAENYYKSCNINVLKA